jgi:flagellar motor switch protein FliN/FliY
MTATSLNREMCASLVEELGIVVGAMIESPATVVPSAPAKGRQWVADIRAEGELTGAITVVLDHAGATAITSLMTGIEGAIPDEALLDTLREVLAQAVGALAMKPVAGGATLSVAEVVGSDSRVPEGEWSAYSVAAEKLSGGLAVTMWGSLTAATAAVAKPAPGPRVVEAAPAPARAVASQTVVDERIDVILDIDLPLVVRFGRTEMPLKALTRLSPGSVIDFGRSPDDPVEVLVSNRVVARGEVVIVAGNYGIRILDVVSQRERVRSMEA